MGLDSDFPLVPLRRLSSAPITNGLGEAGNPDNDEAWPRYIRTTDIATVRSLDPQKRLTLPAEIARQAPVDTDDILMTSAGATVGKSYIHLSGESACFAGYLSQWRVRRDRAQPLFMAYFTESALFTSQVQAGAVKSTIENYSAAKYRATLAPMPSLAEQQAIVCFLDRETAQIDAFIAKNEELVTLLTERRAAAVNEVIWAGVSSGKSRTSAGELLPDAPAHWLRVRNKQLYRERTGVSLHGAEELLTVSHITGVTPRTEKNVTMFEAESTVGYKLVRKDDLVINTMWAWMGALGVSERDGIASPSYSVYRPLCNLPYEPRYFDHLYRSTPYVANMTVHSRGITESRLRLYPNAFLSLPTVVPPLQEQREIVDRITARTTHLDKMTLAARRAIDLARERRAALISAAVTGKIDVGVSA